MVYTIPFCNQPGKAFTLAELLIALVILGVIATFTIPKVLQSQQDQRYNAAAKEVAGALSGARQAIQQASGLSANTSEDDFTPYLNYVRLDTGVASYDWYYGRAGTQTCSTSKPCLFLHNGGLLRYLHQVSYGNTDSTDALYFFFDPDGQVSNGGTTDGPGKSVVFYIYYNGMVRSYANIFPTTGYFITGTGYTADNPISNADPPWFSWN